MIELREVRKAYAGVPAMDGLSLQVAAGEFVVLIGPSGSGKSTTLKTINRLVEPDSGTILVGGRDIRGLRPEDLRRRMGYAIQSTGLFPHWTVARNIATVPVLLGWPAERVRERVDELLGLLGMEPARFRGRWPHELSGGQQQRVGVARALAARPEVLLMDEPFGALDPITRQSLQRELARIHAASGQTIVMVTHDIDEALRLATRIVLLDHGRIVQSGPPAELLARPANDFVADFVGRGDRGLKLLALRTVGECVRAAGGGLGGGGDRRAGDERGEHAGGSGHQAPVDHGGAPAGPPIADSLKLAEALSLFVTRRTDRLPVVDAAGRPAGVLRFADLLGDPTGDLGADHRPPDTP